MDVRLSFKALAVQSAAVIALFALLVALPLPGDFFERWGALTGPLAWAGCALVTARVLGLAPVPVLLAAIGGGIAGAVVFVLAGHTAGMVVALLVFGTACGTLTSSATPRKVLNQ